MSISPVATIPNLPTIWAGADNNFSHYDTIFQLIGSDPRLDQWSEGRVWTVCRTVVTLEQCLVQSTFRGHIVLEKAAAWTRGGLRQESVPGRTEMLFEASVKRVQSLLVRTAKRLSYMMSLSRSLVEVYDMLELFVSNVEVLGPTLFQSMMVGLTKEDRDWIIRSLQFSAFWEPSASATVFQLERVFNSPSLKRGSPDSGFSTGAFGFRKSSVSPPPRARPRFAESEMEADPSCEMVRLALLDLQDIRTRNFIFQFRITALH
ncbi:hypothetical protein RQP46_001999 [Phenoliferia psychrophenolica]